MSRPILSSATRRLSTQPICHRSLSTSRLVSNLFSASSDTPASRSFSSPLNTSRGTRPLRCQVRRLEVSPFAAPRHRAAFTSSSVRPASRLVQNARTNEEGNSLTVDISARAAERLREITDPSTSPSAAQEENPYHHLRITVTSGGCHGFQYMMSLEPVSKIDAEEDTVFESEEGGDSAGKALIAMDEPSLELLSGSTIDYTMELIGSQFTVVDNPKASSNCGCGTSFDVNV